MHGVFVGHLAAALAAKKVEPRVPLAALVAATFGLDLLWPAFLLAGLETVRPQPGITAFTPIDFESYPWSHSLLLAAVWGGIAAFVASRTGRSRAAVVIFALVVSHWVLDWVTHRPDLPLWPGGPKEGLGLWYSLPGTIIVEGALLAFGVALYLRTAPATSRAGHWAFWSLIVFTAAIWLSGPFQPPPPDVGPIATVGLVGGALLILWAGWIDRTRRSVRPPAL
jgi:membrane-bound metal-dependent hydrolase YbcI (DUF457 family)